MHPRTFLAYGYDLGDAEAGFNIEGEAPDWLEDEETEQFEEALKALGIELITYHDGASTHFVLSAEDYTADDDGARTVSAEELRVQTRWVYNLERALQVLGITVSAAEPGWVLATYTS